MPIYEYRCERCSHELDALQKMSDAPLTDCPACEEPGLVKLISAPSFRLKGSGWYETDFKKDGQRNLAGDRDGQAKQDDKKDDKKKEDKKSDTKTTGAADKSDVKKAAPKQVSKDSGSKSAASE